MPTFELTPSNDFISRAHTIEDPVEVDAYLAALHPDLTMALLTDAIRGGLSGRNEVTQASASTAAGLQQWLKTVEDLRTLLATFRWLIHQHKNCPFISSPEGRLSLVVMTGNAETGRIGVDEPTNQAEKGAVAGGFIETNRQLELFMRDSFEVAQKKSDGTQVWALLYHYDKKLKEVRFELSLPIGFNKKKITKWGVRLLLRTLPNNPAKFTIRKDAPIAPATVDVEPKSGTF